MLPHTVARSVLADILKSVGIGWLFLVAMGALATLALALANGGRVTAYPGLLTVGLLASPGVVLLLAGLLVEKGEGKSATGSADR